MRSLFSGARVFKIVIFAMVVFAIVSRYFTMYFITFRFDLSSKVWLQTIRYGRRFNVLVNTSRVRVVETSGTRTIVGRGDFYIAKVDSRGFVSTNTNFPSIFFLIRVVYTSPEVYTTYRVVYSSLRQGILFIGFYRVLVRFFSTGGVEDMSAHLFTLRRRLVGEVPRPQLFILKLS